MNGSIFSCFDATAKITKKLSQSVLPDEICLIYDAKGAFWHFMWSQNKDTNFILMTLISTELT